MNRSSSMRINVYDWSTRVEILSCSPAARGVAISLMAVMHECEPYGHLVLNGRPVTPAIASRLACASLDVTTRALDELVSFGLFKRTAYGAFYCPLLIEWNANGNTPAIHHEARRGRLKFARSIDTHTEAEWRAIADFYGRCLRCGSTDELTKDHIVPLAFGGSDGADNLQPLCRSCNSWKGSAIADFRDENVPMGAL